jgi:hypothetical protein
MLRTVFHCLDDVLDSSFSLLVYFRLIHAEQILTQNLLQVENAVVLDRPHQLVQFGCLITSHDLLELPAQVYFHGPRHGKRGETKSGCARDSCDHCVRNVDFALEAEKRIFAEQLHFGYQLAVEVVLDKENHFADLLRLLFILVAPIVAAEILFLFERSCLNKFRFAHDLQSMGRINRTDNNFWHVVFIAA